MKRLILLCGMLAISACAGTAREADLGTTSDWATVRCEAQPDGSIKNCTVVGESRSGMGFGAEALRIVQQGRLSNETVDGMTAGARFSTTVQFRENGTTPVP